jgi:hypothetical protein
MEENSCIQWDLWYGDLGPHSVLKIKYKNFLMIMMQWYDDVTSEMFQTQSNKQGL